MNEQKQNDSQTKSGDKRRSESEGLMRFGREMTWALAMALVAIVYVIQAFKIPSGSMENSLLTGDFLLGLKFLYGAPVLPYSHLKFPGLTSPKPGHVIIFRYPGTDKKDYIKRCVAGPGQTLQTSRRYLIVNGDTLVLPPRGQYITDGLLFYSLYVKQVERIRETFSVHGHDTVALTPDRRVDGDSIVTRTRTIAVIGKDTFDVPLDGVGRRGDRIISYGERVVDPRLTYFAPLRIPAAHDTIVVEGLPVREYVFLTHLMRQENPGRDVNMEIQLYVDGEFANNRQVPAGLIDQRMVGAPRENIAFGAIPWDKIDEWTRVDDILESIRETCPGHTVEFRRLLSVDGKRVEKYVVKKDNYFMMGDNRDNSADSRYWGYLNRSNVKAKALILYFSLDPDTPWYLLPLKIRWNRIGKLIRSWDGKSKA